MIIAFGVTELAPETDTFKVEYIFKTMCFLLVIMKLWFLAKSEIRNPKLLPESKIY